MYPNVYLRIDGSQCTVTGSSGCPNSVVNALYSTSVPQAGSYAVYTLVPLGSTPSPVEEAVKSSTKEGGGITTTSTIAIAVPVAILGILVVFSVFWFLIKPNFTKYSFSDDNENQSTTEYNTTTKEDIEEK